MKVIALHASPNIPSNSTYLGEHFLHGITKYDCNVHIETYRLYDYDIKPFTLEHYEENCALETGFYTLKEAIISADALLITTPIWNYNVPAVLKNLVDRIGSFALNPKTEAESMKGKPVFIIFTGGAPLPAWRGMLKKTTSSLSEGLAYMSFTPVGTYFEPHCTISKGTFGLVVHNRAESITTIQKKAIEFYLIVQKYIATGALPTYQTTRKRFLKIGETLLQKFF
jgi:multimeric flavodoxin WrbA